MVPATPLTGCSEGTLIRTSPPGAGVYINDGFLGVTPVMYRVPESRFRPPTRYKIEREGYEPLEGDLQTYVAPGRIIGGIFGLGIPFAFRGAVAFHKVHDFQLQPEATAAVTGRPLVERIETSPAPDGAHRATADKLRELQSLYDRGLISKDEYRATRSRIIDGL